MKIPFLIRPRQGGATLPDDAFPCKPPGQLLLAHRGLLHEIRRMVGIPGRHYQALYTPLFEQLAAFCQELPASEAHHHRSPGGALCHGIEVALHAVRLRRKRLLPAGATAEELAARQDLWTYAVVSAALFHDFGKPVADVEVRMLEESGRELGIWNPWRGSLPEQGCHAYRMRHRKNRMHGLHERLPAFFAQRLIPAAGLEWLAGDPDVFDPWSAALCGDWENAGVIGEIVQLADARSVAEDLAGDQKQLPGARQKPLHERLLTGLRYLLDEGRLPLNGRGAAGWVDGESLWLVSKRALDALREHLEQEGHGGIPSRNDRLMDALQQAGCLTVNQDKAIWKVRVFAPEWPKAAELTVLRFPLRKLWPDPDSAPERFAGKVEVLNTAVDGTPTRAAGPPGDDGTPADSLTETPSEPDPFEEAPVRSEQPPPPLPGAADAGPDVADGPGEETPPPPELSGSGARFLAWLRENLRKDLLEINRPSGRLHRVSEGLLLVSPAIFKDYKDPNPEASWQQVQRRFARLKLHLKLPDGTNIHSYRVMGEKSRKRGLIKGFLIPESSLDEVFPDTHLPPPNPHLRGKDGQDRSDEPAPPR